MAEHESQAVIGYGTLVQVGDGAEPENFTTFHEVITADPPDEQADEHEVTHFESPNRSKEFIQGLIDAGEMGFSLNWRPDLYTDHQALVTDKAAGTKRNYRVVLPGGMHTIEFPAFVKGMKPNLGPNDVCTMDVTLRCSGVEHTMPVIS
jgi:hypothetical protein